MKGIRGLLGKLALGVVLAGSSVLGLPGKSDAGIINIINYTSNINVGNSNFYAKNIEGATEGYDSHDTDFLNSPYQNALEIYTKVEGHKLGDDARPINTSGWVFDLGVKGIVSGDNSLRFKVTNTTDLNYPIAAYDVANPDKRYEIPRDGSIYPIPLPNLVNQPAGEYAHWRMNIVPDVLYWTNFNGNNWNNSSLSWNVALNNSITYLSWNMVPNNNAIFSIGNGIGSYNVDVGGSQRFNSLKFNSDSATLNGGILEMNVLDAKIETISNTHTINSNITDFDEYGSTRGYKLTKIGAGTLELGGINTYTGGTYVNAGILRIRNSLAFPTGTNLYISGGSVIFDNDLEITEGEVIENSGSLFVNGNLYLGSEDTPLSAGTEPVRDSTPEPGVLELLVLGGLGFLAKRRNKKEFIKDTAI